MIANMTETYSAKVFVGLKEGYDGSVHHWREVVPWCREYCDAVGLGVNITPINFAYTGGDESGVCVEVIQYPRFPSSHQTIKNHAYSIGHLLMTMFKQYRCTLVCSDFTYLIENEFV